MSKQNQRYLLWGAVAFLAWRMFGSRVQVSGGLLLLLVAAWLFTMTWFGGLARRLAKGVLS